MRRVWFLTLGHTVVDFYMIMFPPLLAILRAHFDLSLVQTSFLPMVVQVFGSVVQPFAGYLADRSNRFILSAAGILTVGVFISAIGLAPSPLILALFLFCAALGSSVFHPTAGGLVTAWSPRQANLALSIFLTGGTVGMALAPVAGTQVVERFGLASTWILVFPAVIVCGCFVALAPRAREAPRPRPTRIDFALLRRREVRPLWTLYSISVLRSLVHIGFINFTAFLGESRGWSTSRIGWVLTSFLVCATLGRIVGGFLGDRVAPRRLLAFSSAASTAFYILFCFVETDLGIACFFLAGFIYEQGIATNIILAQRVLPDNTSTATGFVMGFSWAAAGLMLPVIGAIAEAFSVSVALASVSTLLLPAAALVALLPASEQSAAAAEARA